jgi:lycopene cyclase domain-containing protein
MMEYTALCVISIVAVFFADSFLKTGVARRKAFWYALALTILTQLVADNLTAWRGFWNFNEQAMIGVRVPVIPFENLLFGVALFYSSIISWEFSLKMKDCEDI